MAGGRRPKRRSRGGRFIEIIVNMMPFWLYRLAHYKALKPLVVTEQNIQSFRALNILCEQLSAETRVELIKLNKELFKRVKDHPADPYLQDYEIDVKFSFHLQEGHVDFREDSDNIFAMVDVSGSVWPEYDSEFDLLADNKDWGIKIPSHPLFSERVCYLLHCAMRNAKRLPPFFHCEAIWVDIICRRQRVGYHPTYTGEKFRSCRLDWPDFTF